MIYYDWNEEKNLLLKESRGVGFEEVIVFIKDGFLMDILEHPNRDKYPNQKILIVNINDYIYAVPFVEDEEVRFLKTIIPSRKYTKKYLGEKNEKR